MTGLIFHSINLLILLVVIFVFARKKLRATFDQQHQSFKAQLQEANSKYEAAKAEYDKLQAQMSGLEDRMAEMRSQSIKEIENESARLEQEAERTIQQAMSDGELKINVETERLKASIERDLLDQSLAAARERLASSLKTQDDGWTAQMIDSSGSGSQSRGKKNYAS